MVLCCRMNPGVRPPASQMCQREWIGLGPRESNQLVLLGIAAPGSRSDVLKTSKRYRVCL